ncbi:hypothetical protein GLAREA_09465 [Glarea lozoyensis ATCC 20868]|uniref:Uncharacterized protein n=1 Tax=Glarea lozoyensis (strain ATCC 20868 / MF5171) TaxID=1116229 RepID=S3CRR1_GLAL2|nr:uncharacterized protein GLAREA_09465 [Glarea lozoyensis ATCC 20868]EPE28345.1 hypothetical protein GLAREA_09465 [Glarea lozoyensis ATCC 20868]
MGLWPFGRKKSQKVSHGGPDISRSERVSMQNAGTAPVVRGQNDVEIAGGPERRRSRRDKKRRSSRESKKLKRNPERQRTYSFSPGRNDDIQITRDVNRPPVPEVPAHLKTKTGRSNTERQVGVPAGQKPTRASTQPPESSYEWHRMPTLHKRSAQELARRKSSKKRKEDHQREEEIKAMAAYMPTRPAVEHNSSGRLVKRDSKRVRSGLNKNLQNPSSDISLPTVDSLRTSLSGASDRQTSYVLSAFDMLAPRPTIKYAENPRYAPGATGFGSDSMDSRRRRVSDRMALDQEVLKANRRIDELADDLSAGELRELMERDQKRRDKKKIAERIKMERRIAKKQEKQTAAEEVAVRNGTPPPVNMHRGVLGRDMVGLGIGTSAVVASSKRKSSSESDNGRANRPAQLRQDSDLERPVATFQRTDSLATENLTPGIEREDPVVDVAKVGTVAKAQVSPTLPPKQHRRGQSSISQMMDLNKSEPKTVAEPRPVPSVPVLAPLKKEPSRRSSETSSFRGRAPQSWTSFFRRSRTNKSNKRDSAPPSFSNTSRDSMQNTSFSQNAYTQRPNPNMPKRTMSKFREDLPELPLSPPDSRVQSPEADVLPPIRDHPDKKSLKTSTDDLRVRYDTPNSGYRSLDAVRTQNETPTTGPRVEAPSPEPAAILSQSLASIDSEGSWLSGGKSSSKRGSSQLANHPQVPLHDSANNLQRRYEEYSESAEELGLAEDEYFSRLTPGPEEQYKIHRASTGNPMPSSDEEDGGSLASPVPSKTKWGAVARTPTVVHREPRAKSREGLLNDFEDDSSSRTTSMTASMSAGPDSPISPKRKSFGLKKDIIDENESPAVHRATSVEYRSAGGHTRHISAGSARLLDLSKDERKISSG